MSVNSRRELTGTCQRVWPVSDCAGYDNPSPPLSLRVRSMPHTTLYRMPDDPLLEPLRRQDPPRDDAFWRPKQAWLVSTSPIALDWAAVGGVPDMGNLVRCVLECSP